MPIWGRWWTGWRLTARRARQCWRRRRRGLTRRCKAMPTGVGALLKAADGAALGALLDGVDVLQSDMAALGDRAADPIARMAANAEIDEPNALGDKAAELDKSVGALRDEIEKMVGRPHRDRFRGQRGAGAAGSRGQAERRRRRAAGHGGRH